MIKNEREYRITKVQAEKFERAILDFESKSKEGIHPFLVKAQAEALESQYEELREQIEEYDALKAGKRTVLELTAFDQLPEALIKARIASQLSQKELAEKLGLKEQQIQRYEATSYESASLTRLIEIINALDIRITEGIVLPTAQVSARTLLDKLIKAGLDRDFVVTRLLPKEFFTGLQMEGNTKDSLDNLALRAASILGRIFGFAPSDLFSEQPLILRDDLARISRFKVRATAEENYLRFYTIYAHYLGTLLLKTVTWGEGKPKSNDPRIVRKEIISSYGELTFEAVLNYVWDLGIPVLPLNDSGAFNGACWRIDKRNIIVLKQVTKSADRWKFDLLHEHRHAGENPEETEFSIVEEGATTDARRLSEEEQDANQFAGNVVLNGRANDIAEECAKRARRSTPRLKTVVQQVAREEGVFVGDLANYMAFRQSLEGENWWATAATLQDNSKSPFDIARNVLLKRADLSHLDRSERDLLMRAISDIEV